MTRTALIGVGLWLTLATVVSGQLVQLGPWAGAIGPRFASVRLVLHEPRITSLEVSEHQDFRRYVTVAQQARDPQHPPELAHYLIHHLQPDTLYYHRVVVGRNREYQTIGRFRTLPTPDRHPSFRFAFASSNQTGSEAGAFSEIRYQKPRFFLHLGNAHSEVGVPDQVEAWYELYERALASFTQAELYREIPVVYTWDRQDSGGKAAHQAYRHYVPHYPLPADSPDAGTDGLHPISQAFSVGRARFIVLDTRTARTPIEAENPTLLGAWQWRWLQAELRAATVAHPMIFLVSSVPWHGSKAASGTGDHWGYYPAERARIIRWLEEEGISNVCVLSGNSGLLAARIGTGEPGDLHEFQSGVIDQRRAPSLGSWTHGPVLPGPTEEFLGIVDVTDHRSRIEVTFRGMNQHGHERFTSAFTIDLTGP